MGKRKKRQPPQQKKKGGSMMNLRGGFQGMFSGGKGSGRKGPSEADFFKIMLALFLVGAVIFFASR